MRRTSTDIGGCPLDGLLRQLRRRCDLSQRELAVKAGVGASTIGELESGDRIPSLELLQRLLAATGTALVVVDTDGRIVRPLEVWDDTVDLAGRRFPPHLDLVLDPEYGEWWADVYGLTRPPETFRRNRALRDWQRRQSQWDTRVAQFRHDLPPVPPRVRDWVAPVLDGRPAWAESGRPDDAAVRIGPWPADGTAPGDGTAPADRTARPDGTARADGATAESAAVSSAVARSLERRSPQRSPVPPKRRRPRVPVPSEEKSA